VSLLWKVANHEMPGAEALEAARQEGRDESTAEVQEFERKLAGCDTKLFERLKKACDGFRDKAGIAVEHYDGGEVGAIVRAMSTDHGRRRLRGDIAAARRELGGVDGRLRDALLELDASAKGKR
jgi:hypothetical protein